MRKQSILMLLLCLAGLHDHSFAALVPVQTAQTVAVNFYKGLYPMASVSTANLYYTQVDTDGTTEFYVYNMSPAVGFVIVSADNNMTPVIAYSDESYFRISPRTGVSDWMSHAGQYIHAAIQRGDQATPAITAIWTACQQGPYATATRTGTVGPIVQTRYDQETDTTQNPPPYLYNLYCPENTSQNERCVTGCVATTMTQIMRYWNYPASGTGSYTYTDNTANGFSNNYGTQTANFGAATYKWANMPTELLLNSPATDDTAVSLVMYHAGVSVAMDYGDDSQGGSGAYVLQADAGTGNPCAQYSYPHYFRYNTHTIFGMKEANYSSAQWMDTIEQEINAGRPIQYAGQDPSAGGHTWVCDGYNSTASTVHMNWGWSGYDDGWFSVSNLSAGGYNFSTDEEMLIGIQPNDTIHVTASASHDTICSGDSTELTAVCHTTGFPTGAAAATYSWTPTTGVSCTTCAVTYVHPTATTTYTVTADSAGFLTATATVTITVSHVPAAPDSVKQPTTAPCTGATATYKIIPAVSGATSYTWSVSGTGWSGSSTADTIVLTAGSGTASVSVTANNSCGSSAAYVFTPTHGSGPAAPTSVTLPTAPCTGTTATYTVPAVTGATSYTWTVTGTGWSGTSTTNSITLTAGSDSAVIHVTANNGCGSSTAYTFTAPHAAGPSAPTTVTMPTAPCTGATATYTVNSVSGATSYTWSISGTGWSGSSTTNSITLTAGTGNATVSVTANNSCGPSTAYVFTATHAAGPAAPASATLPSPPCPGSVATYTVAAVSGATSYTWTVTGTGWSGTSTTNSIQLTAGSASASISVTANNACGSSTPYVFTAPVSSVPAAPTSVTLPTAPCPGASATYTVPTVTGATSYTWTTTGSGWTGSSTTNSINYTAGSDSAQITVTADNACGASTAYTFTAPVGAVPPAPTSVTLPAAPCTGATATYTVPAVAGATSYTWSVSGTGWSGTSTTNSITLTAGTGNATVSVSADNTCGAGTAYVFTADHGAGPAAPTSVTLPSTPCVGSSATYTVPAVSGATSYTWTVSGAGWSGTSTTNSITLTAGSAATSISVTANNACGSSTPYTFTAHVLSLPTTPVLSSTPATPCQGSSVVYDVTALTGATSYTWTVTGSGWSGSSTTNAINLVAGPDSAIVSVTADNSCGSSPALVFTAYSAPLPAAATSINVPSPICSGQQVTLSTNVITNASSYNWTYTGTGWSGSSTTDAINLTAGTGALAISVNGVNSCGSGTAYALSNVSVTASPVADFTVSSSSVAILTNVSLVFTGTAPTGTTYSWNFDGGTASPGTGAGPQTVDWSAAGTETVTLTVDNGGCKSTMSDTVQVTKTTGIVAIPSIDAINIVPNPASGEASVVISTTIASTVNIEVYDMSGRLVGTIYNGETGIGQKTISFATDNIASGVYLIKASDGSTTVQKRFTKL